MADQLEADTGVSYITNPDAPDWCVHVQTDTAGAVYMCAMARTRADAWRFTPSEFHRSFPPYADAVAVLAAHLDGERFLESKAAISRSVARKRLAHGDVWRGVRPPADYPEG